MDPIFFDSPAAFRRWLEKHHATSRELLVGYHKKHTGKPSLTWQESVDEALCFGWIDGVRRSLDHEGYTIRFTPRRQRSTWSAINLKRVPELIEEGRMRPAGLAVYQARDPARAGRYSFEQRENPRFSPALARQFRANPQAWSFFQAQPPGYRKGMTFWVTSAKQEPTRLRRLEQLIQVCAAGVRVDPLRPVAEQASAASRKSGKGRGSAPARTRR